MIATTIMSSIKVKPDTWRGDFMTFLAGVLHTYRHKKRPAKPAFFTSVQRDDYVPTPVFVRLQVAATGLLNTHVTVDAFAAVVGRRCTVHPPA